MRPSSSRSEEPGLLDGVIAGGPVRAEVTDRAWLRALLDAEAALAIAQAKVGLIGGETAFAITAACADLDVHPAELGAEAVATGNPVVPLVRRLRAALPAGTARHVHRGATSQDIMDTAAMLVAHRALGALLADMEGAIDRTATLADTHRRTPVAGRTLLQQALPTTFGLVAAGWMTGLAAAHRRLRGVRDQTLAGQLGGAAGTLAAMGDINVLGAYCGELGLAEPVLPWHTDRTRIAELAGALGTAAGTIAKTARDIVLYAQTEVGELREGGDDGGSSTLPHKHNPIRAISAVAGASQAPGLVATLLAAMAQEHQRAAGGWHAEWRPLRALLETTGSAAYHLRASLGSLEIDADRMRSNLDLTHGALLAERVSGALADTLGADEAYATVRAAAGSDFAARLAADPRVTAQVADLGKLLDPAAYLGCAEALVDRALRARS
jgi:3-carboxy-cis,cis-muconate cycloisomerase